MPMYNGIYEDYDNWIIQLAAEWIEKFVPGESYLSLARTLHECEFIAVIDNDKNRIADGIDFRLKFAESNPNYTYRDIYLYLQDAPCSVLEMMMALAERCERDIMFDYDEGERSERWFYEMIDNMGLLPMTDFDFDEKYVTSRILSMINREYDYDGYGGLFRVNDPPQDMREVEIWYQMCWYLNSVK